MPEQDDEKRKQQGMRPPGPQDFDPSILIAPGVALFKHAWDVGKDIRSSQRPHEFPLHLRVLSSYAIKNSHRVEVNIRNCSDCGIYLDDLVMIPPVDQRLDRSIIEAGERSVQLRRSVNNDHIKGIGLKDYYTLPYLLHPDSDGLEVVLFFDLFPQQKHEQHPYALAKITYSKLNEIGPAEISFVIRLRWNTE